MTTRHEHKKEPAPSRWRRLGRWVIPIAAIALVLHTGTWLVQRAYNSPNRQVDLQDWLDENLNADVTQLASMRLRFNLLRNSRLYVNGLEVEHPNPVFSAKFLTATEIIARTPFYSLFRLSPERLDLTLNGVKVRIEENEFGEWSTDGLFSPLSARTAAFPFPMPAISGFNAVLHNCELAVRRRGYEMKFLLDLQMETGKDSHRVMIRNAKIPFVLTHLASGAIYQGAIEAEALAFSYDMAPTGKLSFRPRNCEFKIDNLPSAALPFFSKGLPVEPLPGSFSGLMRIVDDAEGASIRLEGELRDAPLAIFGLPNNAPIKFEMPLTGNFAERTVAVRLGPAGYGGFDLKIPLDESGAPKLLQMHSDVVSIEALAGVMSSGASWPGWFSSVLPAITWTAGKWRGFGWDGDNFRLNLSRSTAGMNLLCEGDMFGGVVKAAMSPGQSGPATASIAARNLDARQLAAKFDPLMGKVWKLALAGGEASLTWRGNVPGGGAAKDWNFGIVFANPVIDVQNSGEWWKKFFNTTSVMSTALPRWGGGNSEPLLAASANLRPTLGQISIVSIKESDPGFRVEFVAQNNESGEVGGWVDYGGDGKSRGELYFVGPSELVTAATAANPQFGSVVSMLASTPDGLRVGFTHDSENGVSFTYHFLRDAFKIRAELEKRQRNGGVSE